MRRTSPDKQLELWIDRYQNLIYSICFQMARDSFEAQDLTQETFLSAYRRCAFFDGANEKAWLCRIAANKCLDYLKAAGRRQIPTEELFFLASGKSDEEPERQYTLQETKQELYQCCMKLKPPYRDAALDYFYREMTIREMAEKTGENPNTLQTRVYRARAMLRNLYRKEDLLNG